MSYQPGKPSRTFNRFRVARTWGLCTAAVLGAALPGWSQAGVAGVLSTTVTSLSSEVTYASVSSKGVPLVTFIGYEFVTTYSGGNTTNNVQLVGDVMVTDPAELATLTLDAASSSPLCSAQTLADRVRLTCLLGQVRAGSAPSVLQVFFKAPRKVDGNGVADADGTDRVSLSGTTLYAEVSDGAGNTNNSAPWAPPAPVALGTIVSNRIKSVLPRSGGKLFSGNAGIASSADVFGTVVTVPGAAGYTTTEIVESEVPLADCTSPNFTTLRCYALDLSIRDAAGATVVFADKLSIKVSIDGTIIPQKVKPQDLVVRYDGDVVGACPAPGVPLTNGKPCINSAVRIKDQKDPDRNGDIEIEFLNYNNGSFRIGA